MVLKKVFITSKPPFSILVGLCLGISISLISTPYLVSEEERRGECTASAPLSMRRTDRKLQEDDENFNFDYGNEDDFNPRIIKSESTQKSSAQSNSRIKPKKVARPRYVSTELGIREKLFIGVMTSRNTIDKLGVAVNKTVAHHVPKLVFFMDSVGAVLPGGMAVVSFSDEKPNYPQLRPFQMLKYIGAHYAQQFDYYMFFPDETYIRGDKILELVGKISVSRDVHLGQPYGDQMNQYCDFNSGIILSQNLLNSVVENLDSCMEKAISKDVSENVGKCFQLATGLPCSNSEQGQEFKSYSEENLDFDDKESLLANSEDFKNSLTVHRVASDVKMFKLHRYFCQLEINKTRQKIQEAQDNMLQMVPWIPGGKDSITWPIGVDRPATVSTRFDVLRWDYFDEEDIFLDNDFSNIRKLEGIHKEDMKEVISHSVEKINEKYLKRYSYEGLMNGYRHFDPTRGMEYKLDLKLTDTITGSKVIKRVNLVRPLSQLEIIPMPYVTESTKVNLILPVTAQNRDGVVSFLDSYAHTCLDAGDNANLFVVFIYDTVDYRNNKDDIFAVLKSMISYYESKYMNGARISWAPVQSNNPTQLTIMDAISKRFAPESLFLYCTVGMELSTDFLNRVRMNTISSWQVFFPIGFWQYKPNLVHEEKPYPTNIEINKNVGHFDHYAYDHASFYNADFVHARKQMISKGASLSIDLFDLFLKYHDVHVFRAVEPTLLHRYRERVCKPTEDENTYHRCLASRAEGLASRSQLAMLIFEHQQKQINNRLEDMRNQNNPNVEQMKPNML